ncbi:MAG: iron-sulfur cluster assembly scaffold protein [Legionella sp.]|uniref:iron-sulfur cluster assembly scaffold protein n=1 Tax=Legionella sp. TaxID=459 RepID=UPI0039E3D69C
MMYNNTVYDCFFAPKHVGVIDPNHELTVFFKNSQKGQGHIELYMQCGEDRIIKKICFKTNGNPYLIAGLEWICRQLEGQSVGQITSVEYQVLVKELDIPVSQYSLAVRIVGVLKEVLNLMKNRLAQEGQHL